MWSSRVGNGHGGAGANDTGSAGHTGRASGPGGHGASHDMPGFGHRLERRQVRGGATTAPLAWHGVPAAGAADVRAASLRLPLRPHDRVFAHAFSLPVGQLAFSRAHVGWVLFAAGLLLGLWLADVAIWLPSWVGGPGGGRGSEPLSGGTAGLPDWPRLAHQAWWWGALAAGVGLPIGMFGFVWRLQRALCGVLQRSVWWDLQQAASVAAARPDYLAAVLWPAMHRHGWTAAQLADHLGVSAETLFQMAFWRLPRWIPDWGALVDNADLWLACLAHHVDHGRLVELIEAR